MTDTANPHKKIWQIAGPAIVANSTAPIVGLVDTWAIGHLPKAEYLAAIAIGSTIFTYIFWAFGFLRMGTTGHAAQAYGQKNKNLLAQLFIRSSIIGLVIAIVLLLFQPLILKAALWALHPPETVHISVTAYYDIRIWAAPFTLFLYTANGFLIGVSKAKSVLVLQLVLNISNMCLNLIFVIGLKMDVAGVALGTLIAEAITASIALGLIVKHINFKSLSKPISSKLIWNYNAFKALMSTNFYLMIRTLLLITVLSIVTRQAGQIGSVELAASQILSTFFMLISLGLDGFAYSAEALAGAAFGARKKRAFETWVRLGFFWAIIAALLYSVIFWGLGHYIINTLTDISAIKNVATTAMPAIIALPIASVWCFQFDGIYIGATASKAMMITMAIAFFVFLIVVFPLSTRFGLCGIWFALGIFMLSRGLAQAVHYPKLKSGLS
ncbi:MATE family efflux transporter [Kordiimonas sp. SCSIO 12610]|uniref:MATE family efflux transporter n=1 Tax=Kordiimonas sp. SCSIO 12610 TaxID=2829597 RepID=UPI00210D73CA|nr:MATE family efflux transporter [Kordiimonas sp. SCSIO 12610]UTW55502.1 MATE family efflux transporter [Kordiimonas sp. SCSIO 12610]